MNNEIYIRKEDGTVELVEVTSADIQLPTQEEIIAQKEAELLAMYQELQALKQNN